MEPANAPDPGVLLDELETDLWAAQQAVRVGISIQLREVERTLRDITEDIAAQLLTDLPLRGR